MNGLTKAAALLVSLGPAAEEVLRRLPEAQASTLRRAMQELARAPELPTLQRQVYRELESLLSQSEGEIAGSATSATTPRSSEANTSRSDTAQLRSRLQQAEQGQVELTEVLGEVPAAFLATALADEQPRTIAIVLHHLTQDQAADVLRRLPTETRREASLRLAQLQLPAAEILRNILLVVLRKVAQLAQNPDLALADLQAERTAALLRQLERQDRKEVLTSLEQTDPSLASRVKEMLYRLEDLLRLQDRSVQKVLAEIDSRTLALALKTVAGEVREKIRRNLSRRAKEALDEEIEFLGGVSQAQTKQAQKQLTDILQRLDLAGELAYEGE